jgi:NADH-quinone oxidoreductase subunit C
MSAALVDAIQARFPEAVIESSAQAGDETVVLRVENLVEVCSFLKTDGNARMEMLTDVTAIDWADRRTPRFEVVYHLASYTLKQRLRIKVRVPEEQAKVPTLTTVWKGANWPERETWDMYGIHFDGHPDLRRILLYDNFEGHPLRKDYPKRGYQPIVDMPSLPYDRNDSEV